MCFLKGFILHWSFTAYEPNSEKKLSHVVLPLCMLGNFASLFSSADFKKCSKHAIRIPNHLYQDELILALNDCKCYQQTTQRRSYSLPYIFLIFGQPEQTCIRPQYLAIFYYVIWTKMYCYKIAKAISPNSDKQMR